MLGRNGSRDGGESVRPEQQVELVVAPDGFIRQVLTVGGLPAELTPDVDDLVPLLGLPLPTEKLRLGYHWTRGDDNTARQSGVVSVFRVDAVILRIDARQELLAYVGDAEPAVEASAPPAPRLSDRAPPAQNSDMTPIVRRNASTPVMNFA